MMPDGGVCLNRIFLGLQGHSNIKFGSGCESCCDSALLCCRRFEEIIYWGWLLYAYDLRRDKPERLHLLTVVYLPCACVVYCCSLCKQFYIIERESKACHGNACLITLAWTNCNSLVRKWCWNVRSCCGKHAQCHSVTRDQCRILAWSVCCLRLDCCCRAPKMLAGDTVS